MAPRVAIVLKGYPRLSETFIAQEIAGLEERGLELLIVSLRRPTDPTVHPLHDRIRAPVLYLPEYVKDDPLRVLRGFLRSLSMQGFAGAWLAWLRDWLRDPTANRARRLAQAWVLAAELPGEVEQIYVHFLHTPGSVGRYAARLRGLPYSLSAHAKDIWTTPAWEKREKLRDARWTVTCTASNLTHLRSLAPDATIELARHGIDLERFSRRSRPDPGPFIVLSVARAVEKKGLDTLLAALAGLPGDVDWLLEHVGGGALIPDLRRQADSLGIASRVRWLGPLDQDAVLAAYSRASLFVLPVRVAADGDRDGLPNVLVEAMSQGLAVISTTVSAVPELVRHDVNGLLVPPDDPIALRNAVDELLRHPARRARLGEAGRELVRAEFGKDAGIDRIAARLRRSSLPAPALACASPSTLR
jgi:glycosyltransferase involved in cell wall biosynthesis